MKSKNNLAFTLAEVFHLAGKSHRFAFTLAEVLITLGIIGVVAAMTMPTLMANYKKKVTVNKFKKAYAEISQAVKLSEAEYGSIDTWDFASQPGNSDIEKSHSFLENYIIKRIKTIKICKTEEFANCAYTRNAKELSGATSILGFTNNAGLYVTTVSGYSILLHPGGYAATTIYQPHVHMLVDIDGPMKGENRVGKDSFVITLFLPDNSKPGLSFIGRGLQRDDLKDDPVNGCNKEANGYHCGALIMQDGWEIKSDYPW